MSLPAYLRVNHPHIIHEIIEGEAILVNLETGSYYSADRVGAVIWDGIENGMPVAQIVDAITHAYGGDEGDKQAGVGAFLEQLQKERLVLPVENAEPASPIAPLALPSNTPPFVAPELLKYTEMEDLLLLDPIHDVDDAGWPHRVADTP